jgi:hypothetical protein
MLRSDGTVAAYLKRGELLWNRAATELAISPAILSPSDFLIWIDSVLPMYKPATRRQYIASIREWLMHIKETWTEYIAEPLILDQAINRSQQMQSQHYSPLVKPKKWGNRTSSLKAKKIDMDELLCAVKQSINMRGKWIKQGMRWMLVNVLVGLRPCEWRHASITKVNGRLTLVVKNAKHTFQRSNGEARHLDISGLRAIELRWIRTHLRSIDEFVRDDGKWQQYYEAIRKTIRRVMRKLFPFKKKYPSMYSTRHQFAANAKFYGFSKTQVAALLGHAVDTTAAEHYGRKKHGRGGCRVKPDSFEVSTVRIKSAKKSRKLKF